MDFEHMLHILGLSIIPISEIRGAIIYIVNVLKLDGIDLALTYLLAAAGNILPVPFIILLFRPLLKFFKKFRLFKRPCEWIERRTHKKAGKMSNFGLGALFLFVAIPLPTTGAWTGAMIAGLFDIRLKRAVPAVSLGVLTAGIIMILLCKIGETGLGWLSFLIK